MKTQEVKNLARRFSHETWGWLCTKPEFLKAVETGSAGEAEAIAWAFIAKAEGGEA